MATTAPLTEDIEQHEGWAEDHKERASVLRKLAKEYRSNGENSQASETEKAARLHDQLHEHHRSIRDMFKEKLEQEQ